MDNSFIRTAKIGERIREIRESNPYLTVNSRLLDLRANLPLCSAILNEHFDYLDAVTLFIIFTHHSYYSKRSRRNDIYIKACCHQTI